MMTQTQTDTSLLLRGIATRNGATCVARYLTLDDLTAVMALQDVVLDDLNRHGHGNFIVPKDAGHFGHFITHGGFMVGIFHNDLLCAQAVLGMPTPEAPDTGMDMHLPATVEQLSVFRGVLVHPAYRGNHFMRVLGGLWLDTMRQCNRTHAVAEVAVENPYSWRVMQDMGLAIVETGIDPTDGCLLYYLHLPPEGPLAGGPASIFFRPEQELEMQAALLHNGYVGSAYASGFVGYARRR